MDTEEYRGGPGERAVEHEADELEERIERLEGHIGEAESQLEERKKAAGVEEGDAGDDAPDDEDEQNS